MGKSTRKSNCPPSILVRLALTRRRQKAWRERPDHMEGIRQRATAKAKAVKKQARERLRGYFTKLPKEMTKTEVWTMIGEEYCRQRKVTEQAFWQQVRNHGLLTYQQTNGLWLNRCLIFPLTTD